MKHSFESAHTHLALLIPYTAHWEHADGVLTWRATVRYPGSSVVEFPGGVITVRKDPPVGEQGLVERVKQAVARAIERA